MKIVFHNDTSEDKWDYEEEIRSDIDEKYYTTKSIFNQLIKTEAIANAGVNVTQPQSFLNAAPHNFTPPINVNLPKLTLPVFEGDLKQWPTFSDLFQNSIHNKAGLSDIEKFQYLLSFVKGEPLNLIKAISLTEPNYQIAYTTLVNRYQNKRLLATTYLNEILNLPRVSNTFNLRNVFDSFMENLDALNLLGFPVIHWDFIILNLLLKKLDADTVQRFELAHSQFDIPTFNHLKLFLTNQCKALETMAHANNQIPQLKVANNSCSPRGHPGKVYPHSLFANAGNSQGQTQNSKNGPPAQRCSVCKLSHSVYNCTVFLNNSPKERFQICKQNKLCINCLSSSHILQRCQSTSVCRICRSRHHTLLHFDLENTPNSLDSQIIRSNSAQSPTLVSSSSATVTRPANQVPPAFSPNASSSPTLNSCVGAVTPNSLVLLATAFVNVLDSQGNPHPVRVLLDCASQANFISKKCFKRLGLTSAKLNIPIKGIGEMSSLVSQGVTSFSIGPPINNELLLNLEAIILPKVCTDMPTTVFRTDPWDHKSNLKLADPSFNVPGAVDLLLGASVFPHIFLLGKIDGGESSPVALNTIFGWVLMGKINFQTSTPLYTFATIVETDDLTAKLQRFWELEEVPQANTLSSEDLLAESSFVNTHRRTSKGQFVVSLPFTNGDPLFSDSRSIALRRFYSLEKRLQNDPITYKAYCEFMKEYLSMGHMEVATVLPAPNHLKKMYYIPHHSVVNPNSSTTKLRVVFDASAKNIARDSLNRTLLPGPKLQKDINAILLNFRRYSVVFSADIKMMYRQIWLDSCHWDYQRIVWRFSPSEPIQDFVLKTVTYGVSSAPFLALRCILELSKNHSEEFPNASKVLQSQMFVDDIVAGANSLSEAILIKNELIQLLKLGGFELRKWSSNNLDFLSILPSDIHQTLTSISIDDADSYFKVLGLRWYPNLDKFSYEIKVSNSECSKRSILSEIARIFDPLGFLAPVTFALKLLMQNLWVQGITWDDVAPAEIEQKWKKYKADLPCLSKLRIPRYCFISSYVSLELHGFGDASSLGYSACIYSRFVCSNHKISTFLVYAKSKVAPLKRISLPRLELCASLLAAKLLKFVLATYAAITFSRTYAWSDSMVSLAWIRSPAFRWKTFVANRVSQIQDIIPPANRGHVASEFNPADCATRGMLPSDLCDASLWWHGPEWLSLPQERWPLSKFGPDPHQQPQVLAEEVRGWGSLLGSGSDLQGPLFITEPPHRVEFGAATGGKVDCTGQGSPPPDVEWVLSDGTSVQQIPDIRLIYPNGSLIFPPFSSDRYRHDVHTAIYRCKLKSTLGVVLSREVHVKAVVKQKYDIQVHDEYVIAGNTAVLKCKIPTYVSDYVMVTSWIQDENINIYPNTDIGGKYVVLGNGDLYISNAGPGDGYKNYACRTVHRLTGDLQTSAYPGRIIVTEPKGTVQPRITVDKFNAKRVIVGDDVTLPCVAQGHPVPGYYWKRESDGQMRPVALSERITLLSAGLLRISKVRLEDKGVYVCFANNSAGEESVRVTLEVTSPLSAHVQPQMLVVDVGKDASFQCVVNGHPVSQVNWMHNGKPIATDNRVEVQNEPPRLTIRKLTKDDRGMYQCFANNNWDQAQATAELNMGDAGPELIYWFAEQTLQPGPTVSLKCVASGNPPPQFTWALDGFPIPDHSRFLVGQYVTIQDDVISHVNITNVKAEDGGEYSCTAHNSVGKVTHSARVNVYGLPFIREMPKVIGVAGTSLIVKCPVAGYPIETISWEREGQQLPVNARQRVYPNGTLFVVQTQRREDAGTYTCQAQNRQRNSARRDVEVQVIVPPKILPINPMTDLLREGMRAAITCQIMEGDLPITFRWERNGKSIINNAALGTAIRRIDEFSSSLIIDQVSSQHSGNYTCIASNIAGNEKYGVPLTVNVPPRWTTEPSDSSVASGQEAIIHCQADGYPNPVIMWKKAVGEQLGEYKDLNYEPNVQQYHNGSLGFTHISKENEGQYLCEAKNNIGAGVSKVIFLRVNAPAHFAQKSKQVQVVKGEQAHLQCSANGDTPMQIMWKVGGQHITKDGDSRYSIREQTLADGMVSELGIERTIRQDTGIFICSASNAYGSDDMNIQLIVQEIPEAPRNVRVMDQQSRSIGISWTYPYAGNSPITNYVVQYKPGAEAWPNQPAKITAPGTQTTASLPNLRPAQVYHLRILAENRLGLSEPSQTVQVNTLEEVPSGSPVDIRAEAKTSTELVVTWEPPSRESWNGNLLGYHVGYQELTEESNNVAQSYVFKSVEVRPHYGGEAILQGLSKFATYSIIVQAYNSRGSGPASEPVTARTLEDAPTLPPENVQCSVLNAQSLHISWEPPKQQGRNGIIQGYKVTYHSVGEWYDNDDQQTKIINQLRTTISGLRKFTNYSMTVLAYTGSGDGVRSIPVYCQTEEDVPSAPAQIKAVLSAPNKILISWLPPKFSNGPLTGYTFYMSVMEDGQEEGTHKRALSPSTEMHEIVRTHETNTLQFWVTASTRIGEGESTRVITVTPSKTVPAKIASFGREVVSAWKQDIYLHCKRVGIPLPNAIWKLNDLPLEVGQRRSILPNATLIIKDIQNVDQANYSCSVENQHGRDEIVYTLKVLVPPDAPVLNVVESFTDSLQLRWIDQGNGGSPILGYVINYKRDHGDWEELQIPARTDEHMLRNLWCGSRYLLYITAFNRIGTGLPCDIVKAHTKGTVPVQPKQSQMLTMNATVATVWLDSWGDGGCGIIYFAIFYRPIRHNSWTTASNHVKPTERIYSIVDLFPATEYQIKVMANNNAGETEALYNFTTLTFAGIVPELSPPVSHSTEQSFYLNAKVWVPIVSSMIISVAIFITLIYRKRHLAERNTQNHSIGESPSMAQMQNKQNRDQQYLAVRVGRGPQPLDVDDTYKPESSDYIEDICPYATFQLSSSKPQAYSESSYSGNVYSGPYHSVRGSFVYHDVKPPPIDKFKLGHNKEPEYTKVRRKGGRLRDPHSESQESDNLGSTDSEVKKILTLHLPISEYDTLGSDSDGDGGGRATSQELMSFGHRMRGGAEGSSTSSESPPSGSVGRKPYNARKGKGKAGNKGTRHVRSSSGYSSHNDETTFSISHAPSFNERIHPPTRFSDVSLRDFADADYEKGHKSRGMSKLTREAFQINV